MLSSLPRNSSKTSPFRRNGFQLPTLKKANQESVGNPATPKWHNALAMGAVLHSVILITTLKLQVETPSHTLLALLIVVILTTSRELLVEWVYHNYLPGQITLKVGSGAVLAVLFEAILSF